MIKNEKGDLRIVFLLETIKEATKNPRANFMELAGLGSVLSRDSLENKAAQIFIFRELAKFITHITFSNGDGFALFFRG